LKVGVKAARDELMLPDILAFCIAGSKQVLAGAGLAASFALVHRKEAEPKVGAPTSVAKALAPLAVIGLIALQVLPATTQVTVVDGQSPNAAGAVTTVGAASAAVVLPDLPPQAVTSAAIKTIAMRVNRQNLF
jgi:hypothetical protein